MLALVLVLLALLVVLVAACRGALKGATDSTRARLGTSLGRSMLRMRKCVKNDGENTSLDKYHARIPRTKVHGIPVQNFCKVLP